MHCQRTNPNFLLLVEREVLNASVTEKAAVPSFLSLPKPPSVLNLVCEENTTTLEKRASRLTYEGNALNTGPCGSKSLKDLKTDEKLLQRFDFLIHPF